MESYLRAMKKNAIAPHHAQITQTPAVGGSPTCKLICMYLHNSADLISLGAQRLCIMGHPISLRLGGWDGKWSRPETGSLRTLEESLPLCLPHHPFFFPSGDSGPEPPEVRILPGSGDPDTKDGTPRMVSGRRVWEMGVRLRFSDQNNLGSNLDSK